MILAPKSIAVIMPAAGKSRRFVSAAASTSQTSNPKKIFATLGDAMVWEHAARALRNCTAVGKIVIAVDSEDELFWQTVCRPALDRWEIETVAGGAERVASVQAALATAADHPFVAVHDAARPLVSERDLTNVFHAAYEHGAALLAVPLRGTIKRQGAIDDSSSARCVRHTVDRSDLWEALTPQVFRTEILKNAYARWQGFPVTDDAQLVERAGFPVTLVEGSPTNIKITVADDLRVANALLEASPPTIVDTHA